MSSIGLHTVDGELYINNLGLRKLLPSGMITQFAGVTAPNGWLICDGSEISKTNYPDLFAVIDTIYGTAADNSKFKLPDLRERVPIGRINSNQDLGVKGGSNSVTLSTSELPIHTHTGTTVSDGIHTHTGTTVSDGIHTHTGTTVSDGIHTHGITDPGHTHSQWTTNDDFNNSGGNPPGFAGDSAGFRTWNNIYSSTTGIQVISNGDHAHTFTTAQHNGHTHTFTTESTGEGASIDIRNKYIVLNYIIRI